MTVPFKHQQIPTKPPQLETGDGFDAMGRPIPAYRRQAAYNAGKEMGVTDSENAWSCINATADRLERDEPFEVMKEATQYVDLTGAYRILAELLIAPKPKVRVPAARG